MFKKCRFRNRQLVHVDRTRLDPIVENGQTMTPSQMERMRQMGQPISAQNLQVLQYENDNPNWNEPAPEHMRGADFGTLWEQQMDIRAKARQTREHSVDIVEPQIVES